MENRKFWGPVQCPRSTISIPNTDFRLPCWTWCGIRRSSSASLMWKPTRVLGWWEWGSRGHEAHASMTLRRTNENDFYKAEIWEAKFSKVKIEFGWKRNPRVLIIPKKRQKSKTRAAEFGFAKTQNENWIQNTEFFVKEKIGFSRIYTDLLKKVQKSEFKD